jgi:lon-related putative ATP-dependent protease
LNSNIDISKYQLQPEQLRWSCPEDSFKFKSTAELEPLNSIVGQQRAVEAIRLGAELKAKGYNIFVTGLSGTGRTTTVKKIVEDNAITCPITYDYCYVNNFDSSDNPILLRLQKGRAKVLSNMMDESISFLRGRIPKLFEDENYLISRKKIIEEYQQNEREILIVFDKKIKPLGFIRGQLENEQGFVQPEVFPLIDNEAVSIDTLDELVEQGKLTRKKAVDLKTKWKSLHDEVFDLSRIGMKLIQEFRKELLNFDKMSAETIVSSAFNELLNNYKEENIIEYVNKIKKHILDNLNVFLPANSTQVPQFADVDSKKDDSEFFNMFKINVILDNSETEKAPVIIETNPTYNNLFGTIEKTYDQRGFWKTDFTKIKAGALLKADQGFLIVNANDLFSEQGSWVALKRVLLYEKLEIQTYDSYFQISQSSLKPEPIQINVKVIIIGGQTLYRWLYANEKEFKKMFKVQAQFDYEAKNTEEMVEYYSKFIAKVSDEDGLTHCSPSGVSAVIEWAVEQSGSKNKIVLKFSDVADLLRESSFYARESNVALIHRKDVLKAIQWRRNRNDLIDGKLRDDILQGTILIDTGGFKIGIINGLTIYNNGIFAFGKPARISANISAGTSGIINIEREADMSGKIHNKGVLIISGFLREKFAQKTTLSLTASLAFEQNYGGIDGDSASAAEIYAILSAITQLPINQSIAITGSVNQKGDIQPIGGVNEKITGFYEICKSRGFNGNHGCIIPFTNINDLMLNHEIVNDCKKGNFHIWAIKNIDEGVEILFGYEAGYVDKFGKFPKTSLYGLAAKRIDNLVEIIKPKKKTITRVNNEKPKE